MRVISGSARGRRLLSPKNSLTRPTADRVKESLFNIIAVLMGNFENCRVLDVFAGSGGLGIEALSRGAGYAVFIDRDRDAAALVEKNLRLCGFADRSKVLRLDSLAALGSLEKVEPPFQLVFIDPPYEAGLAEVVLNFLDGSPLIDDSSLVAVEFSGKTPLQTGLAHLKEFDRRVYGDTAIALFRQDLQAGWNH